jgi:flavorubredoxin
MFGSYKAAPDIDVLTSNIEIPGFGLLPVNAYVLQGQVPILVDTGTVADSEAFMTALRSVIDPGDLEWIWLTHTDFDHIGSLHRLLDENPRLRVITTYLGVGIMALFNPLPMDRVYFLNPGQKITVGTRTLTAFKPPAFDSPSTTGFHDDSSGVLFSSDCFGALLQAIPEDASELSDEDLRDGQMFWATVDFPWLHKVNEDVLAKELDVIRAMEPTLILSRHLPAAPGSMTERILASLAAVPRAQRFVGPDQDALEQLLTQITGGPQ